MMFKTLIRLSSLLTLLSALMANCIGINAAYAEPENPVIIRAIFVDNQNVFNPKIDEESKFIYRLTNALHVKTRPYVIKEYLLFKVGDSLSVQLLEESERILRAKSSLQDANISYQLDGNEADIFVTTLDTWSLKPKLNFSHKGGVSNSEIGIQEDNLLGLGIRASLSYRNDGERESKVLVLRDDNMFGNWHTGALTYIDSTDGNEQYVGFSMPFYALDVKQSYGGEYGHVDKETTIYNQGDEEYRYRADKQFGNMYYGLSDGLTSSGVLRHRVGLYASRKQYEILEDYQEETPLNLDLHNTYLPTDYKSTYPYYAIDYLQNRYKKSKNFEHIGETEDVYMGFQAGLLIGYGDETWGNDTSRLYLSAYGAKTYAFSDEQLLFLSASLNTRYSDAGSENLLSKVGFKYYHAQSQHFKWYADLYASTAINTDENNALYLDVESGMRGYPLNYIAGKHLQKLTLEERYYSDLYIWRIFHVGAAVFFDAGRITGAEDSTENGIYKDVGIGLRLANSRSSQGDVIHIDFSYPMDADEENQGWKFSIESKATF